MNRLKKSQISFQLGGFLTAMLLCIGVNFVYHYHECRHLIQDSELEEIEQKQDLNAFVERSFKTALSSISRTLSLVTSGTEMQNYLKHPTLKNKESLEALWRFIVTNRQVYSQIAFLDNDGMEVIRVDYNYLDASVRSDRLEDQSKSDYFRMMSTMSTKDTMLHSIGLKMEHGVPVKPYRPLFTVVVPITLKDVRHGYMVMSLDIANHFAYLAKDKVDIGELSVLDIRGTYILDADQAKLFGKLLKERKDFSVAQYNPKLWHRMQSEKSGIYYDDVQTYVFNRVNVLIGKKNFSFFTYSIVDRERIKQQHQLRIDDLIEHAIIIALFILIFTAYVSAYILKRQSKQINNQLIFAAMEGISGVIVTDKLNTIIKVNEQFTNITGYQERDVLGKNPHVLKSGLHSEEFYQNLWKKIHNDGVWEGEITNKCKDGSLITELSRIKSIKDNKGRITNYIASFVDISERKELEEQLRTLSERDGLTGLYNRRVFEEHLAFQSKQMARYSDKHFCSLAILDIDHFKRVNDNFGHQKGDEVIQEVANILSSNIRDVDTVARIGGEEFAMILPYTHLQEAVLLLNRKRQQIQEESDIRVTISAGVIELGTDLLDENAYKAADEALYKAKQSGRNQVCS